VLLWTANAGVVMLTAAIAAQKISLERFAMIRPLRFERLNKTMLCYRRAEDWITLPKSPSRFLE
jgi:hypothetical protein